MSRRALIMAAHGSRDDARVNEDVRRCALRVAGLTDFDEVVAAFHAGQPGFADALDRVKADRVTVVPLMTSAGYYGDVVLPRELARGRTYVAKSVHITRPVGDHPALPALVVSLVERRLRLDGLVPQETSVVLVGHGTRRHARSRQATFNLVAAVQRLTSYREVLPAFLDDSPGVDTILARAKGRNLLVFPFLISGGCHATRDIPAALGLSPSAGSPNTGDATGSLVREKTHEGRQRQAPMSRDVGTGACPCGPATNADGQTSLPMPPINRRVARNESSLPLSGTVEGRFVVCEPALGSHPDTAALVADLAGETAASSPKNRSTTGEALERTS